MTKITVHDKYLNKTFSFFVNQQYNSIEEAEKELRIYEYLYFSIIITRSANCLERVFIPLLCKGTRNIIDVLFCSCRYLIKNNN